MRKATRTIGTPITPLMRPGGQPATTAQGWSGRTLTSNGSGGWVTAKHVLTGLGGQANVKLRIAFAFGRWGYDQGFAFDSFRSTIPGQRCRRYQHYLRSASPVVPLVSQPVTVTVKNYGTSPLTTATIGWSVNNVAQPAFSWTGNLALNAVSAPVQIGSFAFPSGVHKVKTWSKLTERSNRWRRYKRYDERYLY